MHIKMLSKIIVVFIYVAFEKHSILFKFKKDEDFNRRHTLSISRIEI